MSSTLKKSSLSYGPHSTSSALGACVPLRLGSFRVFRGRMGLCKASGRRQCRIRIQGCIHHNPCIHTATSKVMQVCLIQVRPYAIRFTTARAVPIDVYYCNRFTSQRASECRSNRLNSIHDSTHSTGRVRQTPVTIINQCSIAVNRVSETLTLNSSTAIPGLTGLAS